MGRVIYKQIDSVKISDTRNLVISEVYDKCDNLIGYRMTEQLVVDENDIKPTRVFLREGLSVMDRETIKVLKNVLCTICDDLEFSSENF